MTEKRIPQLTQKQIDRFWGYIDKSKECWEWQGTLNKNRSNYGIFGLNGKNYATHRIAYFLVYKVDPADLCVCHTCDNRLAQIRRIYFLARKATMRKTAIEKGRNDPPIGERNGQAKVNEKMVVNIRKRFAAGETQTSISKSLDIDNSTIGYIVRRATWKHI